MYYLLRCEISKNNSAVGNLSSNALKTFNMGAAILMTTW